MAACDLVVEANLVDTVIEHERTKPLHTFLETEVVVESDNAACVVEHEETVVYRDGVPVDLVVEVEQSTTILLAGAKAAAATGGSGVDDDISLAYNGDGSLNTVTFDYGEVFTMNYVAGLLDQVTTSVAGPPIATLSYTGTQLTRVVFGVD